MPFFQYMVCDQGRDEARVNCFFGGMYPTEEETSTILDCRGSPDEYAWLLSVMILKRVSEYFLSKQQI